jgi:hypothetical protein
MSVESGVDAATLYKPFPAIDPELAMLLVYGMVA